MTGTKHTPTFIYAVNDRFGAIEYTHQPLTGSVKFIRADAYDDLVAALEMVLAKALNDQEPDYNQVEKALAKARGEA